jgi:putative cell wall-binding protein
VKIAGGPGSVSPQIEAQLNGIFGGANVDRLSGLDRYEASLNISADAFSSAETAYIAVGTKFPDALAGSALSALDGAPLFVVPGNCVPQSMLDEMDAMGVGEVVLLGGPGSLTVEVFKLIAC